MNDNDRLGSELNRRYYPAKVLVLGEYSILLGSDAYAIPLRSHRGEWVFPVIETGQNDELQLSHQEISRFFQFLSDRARADHFSSILDLSRMERELSLGISFKSNIPQQSGLGSSGALVAAIYDRYRNPLAGTAVEEIRKTLSELESHYHSKSSGIDPLVSLVNKPVWITGGDPRVMNDPEDGWLEGSALYLIHSGAQGLTKRGVTGFWNRMSADPTFTARMETTYIPLVNKMVNHLTNRPSQSEQSDWAALAALQTEMLGHLFPPAMKKLSEAGLKNGLFALKICGSGGGGFFLAFTAKPEEFTEYAEFQGISLIRINH